MSKKQAIDKQEPMAVPPQKQATSADVSAIFGRLPKGADAFSPKSILKPRRVSFDFDGSHGAPGVFTDEDGNYVDIKITLESLDAVREVEAMKNVGENPAAVGMNLAKAMLVEVSGKRLTPEEKDFVWEALGSTGRQMCMMASQNLGASLNAALGKYQNSFTVG